MRTGFEGGQLKILTKRKLYAMYLAILNVLEFHGVRIECEPALKLLDEAGATVDYKEQSVLFPEHLVEESLRKAPKRVRMCGRDSRQDFVIEGRKTFFGTVSGAVYITDVETGERRRSVTQDMANTAKISDALENQDYVMGLFSPLDAPTEIQGLYEQDAIMSNTVKHSIIFAYHGAEVTRKQIEIAKLIAGGEEELRKRPIVSMYDEPASPFIVGKEYAEALIEWAKEGLPIIYAPCPMGGATAPITLAGEVVSGMAESTAGNVIAQLVNLGTPFIFGFVPLVMDMSSGLASYAAPENILLGIAQAQLAHYLKIPLWGTGGCTDSKTLDAQTFAEASMNLTTAALSGQNLIHDIGLTESAKSACDELLVICDEIIGMLKRVMVGVEVNDSALAVEEIERVRHGGSYLALKHTRDHFRRERWIPELADRTFSYELWKKKGAKNMVDVAKEKIRRILKEHVGEPLPQDVRRQIDGLKKPYRP